MAIMINQMQKYWENTSNLPQPGVRHKFAKEGRLLGLLFTSNNSYMLVLNILSILLNIISLGAFVGIGIIYSISPFLPLLAVLTGILNGPVKVEFPYPTEYFIDAEKYFNVLLLIIAVTIVFSLTIVSAIESLLFAFTLYACGMFAEVG